MPRISFRDYQSGNRPWWEYAGDAGKAIAGGFEAHRKQEQDAADRAATERKLDIEEDRAKVSALAEVNRTRLLDEREAARAADRQAAVEGLQELAGKKRADAAREGIDAAIKSPQGVLGPFGMATRMATGAATGVAKVQAEMGPKIELAKTMSPPAARQYLERETQQQKQQAIAEGYQKETEAVLAGVQDGVLDQQTAQNMVNAIQTGLRAGTPPGRVHSQVAKAYDLHAKVQKRLAGWEESDRKAGEVMAMLEKMAQTAVVPSTSEKLLEQLAKAKGEWGRTQHESFRTKNDGEASLAGLEAILFGAQVTNEEMPTGIEYSEPPPDPAVVREGSGRLSEDKDVMRAQQPELSAGGARRTPPTEVRPQAKAELGQTIETAVAARGREAITAGADQQGAIQKLLLELADETGLDPRDPFLEGALTDALVRLQRGKLAFADVTRPKSKMGGREFAATRPGSREAAGIAAAASRK